MSILRPLIVLLAFATLTFAQYGDISNVKLAKPEDKQDVTSTPPPDGALVLFDGKQLDQWEKRDGGAAGFKLVEGNAMQVNGGDIVTKEKFDGHFKVHVEFRVPYMPDGQGQGRGNSGVYAQGRYETQVLDSYGKPIEEYQMGDCGCIYGVSKAKVNACKAPTVWQSYDIDFTSPVFEDGKKVKNARMTVHQNGTLIQDNVDVTTDNTTSGAGGDPSKPGPIMLQDHGAPVQYRNIWLVKLDK